MHTPNSPRRRMTARLFSAIALLVSAGAQAAAPTSVALWYAPKPPLADLAQYEWAVLEPGHMQPADVRALRGLGGMPFAYLSVGELAGDAATLEAAGLSGAASDQRNHAWGSQVMDLTAPAWRNYLLNRAQGYQEQGYAGLFLDTLDSFQLQPAGQREQQRQALVSWIQTLHSRFPGLKLIFNRGFEILPELPGVAAAIAVESIHAGWDAGQQQYRPVPPGDREWLVAKLAPYKARGIPLIAIEYLPPEQGAQARALSQRLCREGFIAFVSTPQFNHLYLEEVQPRAKAVCN